ncbi:beta-lactamase family protein [Christiangramia gaetbulicola]|uniref:Beta-lactamase family protein n=1 Tax=Christiangramia gaetbulicola TaxID=703340 RepID=A0A2T6AE09_9FLAO|nr:serine hydrolase [Christiangramia gaetbulicola]PTX42055.1 beta-lactamase family protein [Christiangramia gaetbulicola]
MRKILFLLVLFFSISSCSLQNNVLKQVSNSKQTKLSEVFKNPGKYEVQIIYSRIIKKDGKIDFKDFKYRVEPEAYFYPASTVKLPVAVLSLEKINELNKEGIKIDKNTPYHLENDSIEHTIANDIDAIFAVSDNGAYNRLFEFLGQDYINSKLRAKGIAPVRISHRFSGEGSGAIVTRQMIFDTENGNYEMPVTNNKTADSLKIQNVIKGVGYMKDGEKVPEPFSFELKNYFPIETQHNLMKRLYFPETFEESNTFQLTDKDKEFLKEAMSRLPRELDYDETEYYDSYGKFFIYGDSKERIPSNIKIYNKVGYAYGTLTETAYIKDVENDVEFLLSATLLVNENGVFNDNDYEYDEIGIPFMAELGREIYKKELARKK